jgi:hypothetical protein
MSKIRPHSLLLVAALLLASCSKGERAEGPVKVCLDSEKRRVVDENCEARGAFYWWYFRNGTFYPYVGERTRGGGSALPIERAAVGVSRGGFGATGEAAAGGIGE